MWVLSDEIGVGTHTHRCVYVIHSCSWSVGLAALSALWALLGMLSGHGISSWTWFSLNLQSFWIFLLPLWLLLLLFLARIFSSTQPLRVEFVNPKFSPYFDSGYFPYLISAVPTASIFLLVHNSCVSLAKSSHLSSTQCIQLFTGHYILAVLRFSLFSMSKIQLTVLFPRFGPLPWLILLMNGTTIHPSRNMSV